MWVIIFNIFIRFMLPDADLMLILTFSLTVFTIWLNYTGLNFFWSLKTNCWLLNIKALLSEWLYSLQCLTFALPDRLSIKTRCVNMWGCSKLHWSHNLHSIFLVSVRLSTIPLYNIYVTCWVFLSTKWEQSKNSYFNNWHCY